MATQYSILSVSIRPEIQEQISIGLLLFDKDEVYFSYSKNKLSAARFLLSTSSFKVLKDTLENIESKIEGESSNYSYKKGFKIFANRVFDNTFSASHISYLSRYSNNILTFTQPKEININLSDESFRSLFRKYIDYIIESFEPVARIKPFEAIKERFGERITTYYDLNREVTPGRVPNLITPVRVDFVGKNEIDVYAQTVDMEASVQTVISHINAFVQLKTTYLENRVDMQDFLIAKEPDRNTYKKQHEVWTQLKNSSVLNYLDLSESEALVKYAEDHGVIPLSMAD